MAEEKTLKHATLCFLTNGPWVLLARKLRFIGAGKLNGYGGGIEQGETPTEAIIRECQEECGIVLAKRHLTRVAVIDFHNTKESGEQFICRVHVFLAPRWDGIPSATEEMGTPEWFPFDQLPLMDMMPADRSWLPIALTTKRPFTATASYSPHQAEVIGDVEITYVDRLPD